MDWWFRVTKGRNLIHTVALARWYRAHPKVWNRFNGFLPVPIIIDRPQRKPLKTVSVDFWIRFIHRAKATVWMREFREKNIRKPPASFPKLCMVNVDSLSDLQQSVRKQPILHFQRRIFLILHARLEKQALRGILGGQIWQCNITWSFI